MLGRSGLRCCSGRRGLWIGLAPTHKQEEHRERKEVAHAMQCAAQGCRRAGLSRLRKVLWRESALGHL